MVRLELIVDKKRGKEIPRVLMVSAWIEFCMGMMTGEVEKGGCRELRANTELYATALQSNRDLYERVVDRRDSERFTSAVKPPGGQPSSVSSLPSALGTHETRKENVYPPWSVS